MSADKHARIAVTVAVTSSMLVAATGVFAWTFTRFTETEGYRYCFLLIVYGTAWMLVSVFAAGVAWSLAEQVGAWLAGPKPPTPPPTGPKPEDTPRPAPGPIQPRPPKPSRSETTLVDMAPVEDVTQEIPVVGGVRHGYRVPRHVISSDWRPPVSNNSKENA